MARKFVNLDEAAQILGVTTETLAEMRDRREVHGYRDGSSWKFKQEDIERVKADREAAAEEGDFAEVDEDPDSILLSEVELGQSGESTSSTIIGGKSSPPDPLESDIQISPPKHDSDVLDDVLGSGDKGGSDVLQTGPGSSASSGSSSGSGVSPMFDELDNLDLEMPSAADSGISSKAPDIGSSVELASESSIEVDDGSADATDVADEELPAGGSDVDAGTSDITLSPEALELEGSGLSLGGGDDDLALDEEPALELEGSQAGGSDIDLTGDIDDDLVLGGSSAGDVSRAGDSGISLLDPGDSGISLESPPLELGGSGVDQLELGEDDELLGAAGESAAEELADDDAAPEVAAEDSDDDFLLTPLEEASEDESDSGSQVIALEDDVEFEEEGVGVGTLESEPSESGLLDDDLGEGLGEGLGGAGGLETVGTVDEEDLMPATAPAGAAAMVPETPFTGWNVGSLVLCSLLLLFCGMFMYDLMRNIWSWDQPYTVNSSMMDMILSWFE